MIDPHETIIIATFLIFAVPLSVIDIHTHTLPNRIVFTAFLCLLLIQAFFAYQVPLWEKFQNSLQISVGTFIVYCILYFASRGKLGMGDVKFALPVGLAMGWVAPNYWLVGIWVSFTVAAIIVTVAVITRRMTKKSAIAFGPFMSLSVPICVLLNVF